MSSSLLKVTGAVVFAALLSLSSQAFAQSDDADAEMRIQRLEQQLRQLGGTPPPAPGQQGVATAPAAPTYGQPPAQAVQTQPGYSQPQQGYPQQQQAYPQQGYPQQQQGYPQQQIATPAPIVQEPAAPGRPGRRGDAFDPSQNPNAPGAPQALGGGRLPVPADGSVGVQGGRAPGEPLDLSNGANPQQPYPQAGLQPQQQGLPPPPARNPNGTGGGLATAPPTNTPRDEYDLGIGYMQRKDYALAEETMKNFAQKYPNDALVGESQYWLGESYFQRQQFRDAAETFLNVTSKYEKSAKAPDALLRLGQSLAALKEKEAACAAFGEVMRKYPKASAGVKAAVDREQKRVKC